MGEARILSVGRTIPAQVGYRRYQMMSKLHLSAFLLCAGSAALGASIMDVTRKADPPIIGYNYVFYSDVRGEKQISIKANGETEIGPHYDRAIEAKKLFEMVKRMRDDGMTPDCHETGYTSLWFSPPENGEAKPYDRRTAFPPPLILERRL